jgi:hypothetical protein
MHAWNLMLYHSSRRSHAAFILDRNKKEHALYSTNKINNNNNDRNV